MEGGNGIIANGWPLGLIGNMNSRIGMVVAPPLQPPASSALRRSSSFSSFSSSNLDTMSTASFFPDQSVSLGRLIGIRAGNKARSSEAGERCVEVDVISKGHRHNSPGILCVPLFQHVIGKMGRTRTTSTQ